MKILFAIFALPAIGLAMAIMTGESWWLVLLVPLLVLMEGGIFLIAVAVIVFSCFASG